MSNRYLWTREKWEEQQALIESSFELLDVSDTQKPDDMYDISIELPKIPDRELGEFNQFLEGAPVTEQCRLQCHFL